MTGEQTFVARTALGLGAGAATLFAVRWRRMYEVSSREFERAYLIVFAAVRLCLFAAVFLVLRLPVRGDLPAFYMQEAWHRLAGEVPYRDFGSSYAPLSSYVYAGVYSLHRSPLTLVLFAVVVEIAAAVIWVRVLRAVLPERVARTALLLCVVNPISLQFVTVDGQNNVLISFFLAAALWLLLRGRAVGRGFVGGSGASVGLSIAAVKFLPLLFTPAFVVGLRRRGPAWAVGCGAVVGAVYGYFVWVLRAPVWQVFTREGDLKTAGGLPYLVESMSGIDFGLKVWDRLLLVVLGALTVRLAVPAWRGMEKGAGRETAGTGESVEVTVRRILPELGLFLLAVMALAKKTWPTYSVMVLFPLAAVVGLAMAEPVGSDGRGWLRRWGTGLFVLFSVLSVTVHSFWASLLVQAPSGLLHAELLAGSLPAWVLLGLEVLLFAVYVWLILLCLHANELEGSPAVKLSARD